METTAEALEPFVPLAIVVSLTLFMTLEALMPYFELSPHRRKQRWHNLGNLAISFALNAGLSILVAFSLSEAQTHQFGLMRLFNLPPAVVLIAGIFLCDLNSYVAHRLYHRVPAFWRFHRVHHSDVELDASSALRMHPFEFVFQAATQAGVLALLGVPGLSLVLYTLVALPLFVINHANLKLPGWYHKTVGLLIVTPDWHRVHHSAHQPETDSNYADVFTLWDRLFFTHRSQDPGQIKVGLETEREPRDQTLWAQLRAPFNKP